jgi:hypothetical protein
MSVAVGSVALVGASAAVADIAWGVARNLYDSAVARAAAGTVLATSLVVVVLEVVGIAGVLWPVPVLGFVGVLWLVYRVAIARRSSRSPAAALSLPELGRLEWLPAVLATGLLLLLIASLLDAWLYPHFEFDSLYYHLPIAVQWLQAHNVRLLPFVAPGVHAARYPANFELIELWLMLPVHRAMFVQLAPTAGLLLMMTGIGLLARSAGAGVRTTLVAMLIAVTLPCTLVSLIGSGYGDLFMAGALTVSAGFVARYRSSEQKRDLLLAGLGAGLAVGARYQALVDVLPLVGVAVVTEATRRARLRSVLGRLLMAAAALLVTGGYFYVRNAVATGNPSWPKPWSLPFHSFPGVHALTCCDQPSWIGLGWQPGLWAATLKQVVFLSRAWYVTHAWGPILLLLLLGGMLVPIVSAACRRERIAARWAWALYPLAQTIAYLATPDSAGYAGQWALTNMRFLLHPLAASAALLAAESERLTPPQKRIGVTAMLGLSLLSTVLLSTGITRPPLPPAPVALVLAIPIVAAARYMRKTITLPVQAIGPGLLVLAVAVAASSSALMRHFRRNDSFLSFADAAAKLRPLDRVVSVAGICEIYALYGPTLDRRVLYVTGAGGLDPPLGAWVSNLAGSVRRV